MKSKTLTQAVEIQNLASDELKALANEPVSSLEERIARASALRNMASVWEMSVERARIARGKPLPGSLRPVRSKLSRRPRSGPLVESAAEPEIEAPEPAPASPTPHSATISPIEPSEG